VAYKHASNYCDGGNCDWFRLYFDWHCHQIDCNQLGLCIDEYIAKLFVISLNRISRGINGGFDSGFDGGFDGGSFNQFHLAVLGYQPQQSIRQLR
jgi:hypothetical protein